MKVLLPAASNDINDLNYDTVYINLEENTAKGYCERNFNYCKKGSGISVAASDFIFKTPFNWIDDMPPGTVHGSESVNGRQTLRYEYFKDDTKYTVFIDSYFGLPILVKIGDDTKGIDDNLIIYEYKELAINSVQDKELTPPG